MTKDIRVHYDEAETHLFTLPDTNGMRSFLFQCTECTVECMIVGEDDVFIHFLCDYCDRIHYVSRNDIKKILS